MIVKVEYANPLTLHVGSVFSNVSKTSKMSLPRRSIVDAIFDVNVERIFALTPLPKPSLNTIIFEDSF